MRITDLMGKDLSIYVHIPFCVRKCLYCDFLSDSADEGVIKEYFSALSKEIWMHSEKYRNYTVKSVFFGGGTPSFPDEKYIVAVLKQIKKCFFLDSDAEISIESNPGTVSYEKLKAYRDAGINRLSIGAQSLCDDELKRLGRIHDSRAFFETYEMARRAGFDNINVDVMSALPRQSLKSYMSTLEKVVELRPQHISAYSLIIEEGTPFYDMDLDLPSEEEDREMYHETKRFLSENGYHRYEISNYALDGYECYHNKVYWMRGNYLGLGIGAASMVNDVRWSNIRDIDSYVGAFRKLDTNLSEVVITDKQILKKSECMEEFMFLGLRLVRGVGVKEFKENFGKSILEVYGNVIEKYKRMGLLEYDPEGRYLRLTDEGLDVSNTVMADFLLE